MSDRTTKSSTRSKNTKAKVKGTGTTTRRRPEPQLGELEFSEWYEATVFEPSSEERMETMATEGRAPARLVARVVIAAGARREKRRSERQLRRSEPEPAVEEHADAPLTDAPPTEAPPTDAVAAEVEPVTEVVQVTEPEPEPEPETVPEPEPETVPEVAELPEPEPVPEPEIEPEPEPETVCVTASADQAEPDGVEDALGNGAEPDSHAEPEAVLMAQLDRPGWRNRANALLDKWAEKEVAVATRLDEALAPAIPWASGRKPAHARRRRQD
jgi:outer membrane biosynthesis protein TonB